MGGQSSKKNMEQTATNSASSGINNLQFRTEMISSYEAACRVDSDLHDFDSNLQERTNNVLSGLAGGGVEVRALSFDSLKEITGCLLEMNQEVVKVILECKKDIWKSQELFDLVEDYFENSLKTLDFCVELDKCLKRARDRQLMIHIAIQQFEAEDRAEKSSYSRTLEELRSFREAGDPFTEQFFHIFQSVYSNQIHLLEKLNSKKNKLDHKLKRVGAWRKISSVIFAAAFAAVLICAVVAAAVAAPPVAGALAAASSVPIGSMGKWIDSLLKSYETAMRGQKEIINSMQVGTYVSIKDLDSIRVLIDRLEIEIEAMMNTADFAVEEGGGVVKICVEEIKKKVDVFMKNVEELGVQADVCSRDIRRARTVILQRIIKPPNH